MAWSRSAAVLIALAGLCLPAGVGEGAGAPPPPLQLEAKIPLGPVKGRIDHLAVDLKRRRLFVAELGNGSVGVVDLAAGRTIATIGGQHEPQGLAYLPSVDTLFVANGGDGAVRTYQGQDLKAGPVIHVGDDADNVRLEPRTGLVWVGHGGGAIAVLDPRNGSVAGEVALKAHPESFQFDASGARAFVNVPNAAQVAVVDAARRVQVAAWPVRSALANFPMAVGPQGQTLIVTRLPARLLALNPNDGRVAAEAATCGDSDDVFTDARRGRVYVTCGEGRVDVFAFQGAGFSRLAQVPTAPGARTSLYVPELDRLYVAVRAGAGQSAAVWVLRPQG